ncbi:unnamed protein product [Clonostachys chloroleuca]|uniref:Major facilitator superfamily (MFS) profile domain-containing protein n=1 Tax=Clonostachys chloroleuca TaxID=1926264 RepID=A0AA35Q316_9HYPO|nr:unnamed protein product [Clonostachys chloroleuca]
MTSQLELPPDLETRSEKRTYIRQIIDLEPNAFNWLVWEVSASGFFTDSYNLFATNVILPSLAFVYWPKNNDHENESLINIMSLVGALVGQLLFGYLADRLGRTRLYGIELLIVIVTTITVCAASQGVYSINIVAWIVAMRFAMGIGIGGEYPLSAAICTEWAPTQARPRMMSAVFLMQPLGQLVAQLVGLAVLAGYNRTNPLTKCMGTPTGTEGEDPAWCRSQVDSIWRWIIGVGAIPAVVAIYFRFQIKDPGLYDLDVRDRGQIAVENTQNLYRENLRELQQIATASGTRLHRVDSLPVQLTLPDMRDYFWNQGNWRLLAGTSACWFLLDVAFYGLGIGSPQILANVWASSRPTDGIVVDDHRSWNPGLSNPSIYEALLENAKRNILTVCLPSLLGSLLVIWLIDYIPRKQFLIYSFLALAMLMFITGGTFRAVAYTEKFPATIVLVALCNFLFNFGANTLTFIIPAELFPTSYRATCHGIAAASGKLGSVLVQVILPFMKFDGNPRNEKVSKPGSTSLGYVFLVFGGVMALGALFAWVWIPSMQNPRAEGESLVLQNKTLEELAEGVERYRSDGQVIGMRDNFKAVYKALHQRLPHRQREPLGEEDVERK